VSRSTVVGKAYMNISWVDYELTAVFLRVVINIV
jgi:hypothetical protein